MNVTVKHFDELNERGKERAHSDYLREGDTWPWSGEARATIKAVENLFGITLRNWEIGGYMPSYPSVIFGDDWTDEQRNLSGNRARAFLWNRFGNVLCEPRRIYRKGKYVVSRIFKSRVYDGTCPLTGVCFDCDALDPMAYFCYGVEWNETAKTRTQTKNRTLRDDNRTTVESIVRDCVYSLFSALNADCAECESREYFAEKCEANGWTFTEDGLFVSCC